MIVGIDAHNLEGNRTGVGRYLLNLLQEWSKLNSQLPPASPSEAGRAIPNSQFILYFKDEIPRDIPVAVLFQTRLLKVSSTAKFMNWDLGRAAAQDKVDILFCPDYRAPIFYRGPVAVTIHDISYEAHPGSFNWPSLADKILLKWASKKTAQKAKIIFAPSEFTRQEIIKYYGVSPAKVAAIYLGVDFKSGETQISAEEIGVLKKKYGLKDNFIFFVGSIFSRRHLPEVIEAFGRLAASRPDYQLLIVGRDYTKGTAVNQLVEQKNKMLGRPAILRVDFLGNSELKSLYSACAFFVWLSDYEGFGLPPLEAMSLGAPVITSDSSSLKEVVGQAACLIKNNNDIEEIYRAFLSLAVNPAERQKLALEGRKQAERFSWKKCAELTLKLLIG